MAKMIWFAAINGIEPTNRKRVLLSAVFLEGGLVVVAWLLGRWFDEPVFASMQLTIWAVGLGVLGFFPLFGGLWLTQRSNRPFFQRLRHDLDRVVALLFKEASILDLAIISALAGIGEEALFRGFLQPWIANGSGLWAALVITNIIFGALHLISFPYGIMAMGVGVYLGLLQVVSGNLLAPVITHAVYDFIGLVYLTRLRKRDGS